MSRRGGLHLTAVFSSEVSRFGTVFGTGVLTLLCVLVAQPAVAQACPELPSSTRDIAIRYLVQKYQLPLSLRPQLVDTTIVKGTCYTRLRIEGHTANSSFEMTVYASPDGRFLTSDLMDTSTDPLAEERKQEQDLMRKLAENAQLYAGPADAPVTMVLFSDMECPFCKGAAAMLKSEIRADALPNVRLIYRHFPLPMHNWARAAAMAASCAGLQSREAFWKIHDSIFENQNLINVNNIGLETDRFANAISDLDMAAYRECIEKGLSAGLIARDFELGLAAHVMGTPTLFVNGRRTPLPATSEEFRAIVSDAVSSVSTSKGQ